MTKELNWDLLLTDEQIRKSIRENGLDYGYLNFKGLLQDQLAKVQPLLNSAVQAIRILQLEIEQLKDVKQKARGELIKEIERVSLLVDVGDKVVILHNDWQAIKKGKK